MAPTRPPPSLAVSLEGLRLSEPHLQRGAAATLDRPHPSVQHPNGRVGVLPSERAVPNDPQGRARAPRPLWPSPSPGPHWGPRGLCLGCPSWLPPGARRRRSDGASAELPVVCVPVGGAARCVRSLSVLSVGPGRAGSGRAAQPRQDLTRQKNVRRAGGGARLPYLAATQGGARVVVAENPKPLPGSARAGWAGLGQAPPAP